MKKLFVLLLSAALLTASVPSDCLAASSDTKDESIVAKESTTETVDQTLEKIIKSVKSKLLIPKEYTTFNYYFYDTYTYQGTTWSLTWTNPKNYAHIMINCDSNAHITYFYQYDSSNPGTGIAKYLKSELKTKADDFTKVVAPEIASSVQLVSTDYESTYSGNYIYRYQRVENGVAFPDNFVTIGVNSVTGEATSATINWLYDKEVPSADAKLSQKDAVKLLKENMKMKLMYVTDYSWMYSGDTSQNSKAFLVYTPSQDYISIDANSGKVYNTGVTSYYNGNGYYSDSEAMMMATGGAKSANNTTTLTEEEASKINDLKGLISKSDAIKKVTGNSYLYLDENLTSYTATLQRNDDGGGNVSYVWYINLSDPRPVDYTKDTDYYRGYASATVDAKTGKIMSFYSGLKSYYDVTNQKWNTVKVKYTQEQSKAIFEKFLKTEVKSRFDNSVMASQSEDYGYIAYYKDETPVIGRYNYQYNRTHEGVEYPNNYLNGSVDGITGKIYSFNTYWQDNVTFESPKGAISEDAAMDAYINNGGFGLKYDISLGEDATADASKIVYYYDSSRGNQNSEIRLVYHADMAPAYISPFSGKQLNYNGKEYQVKKSYSYKDIDNSPANRNIQLLSDMNIGFEGENFLPNQFITSNEIKDILSKAGYSYYAVTDTNTSNNLVTREELAKTFITYLGLEKLSKLKGVYKTGYADEYSIGEDYLGAVALAKGLGIITADANNNFNPKNNVTRLEACNMIVNFISSRQGVIY